MNLNISITDIINMYVGIFKQCWPIILIVLALLALPRIIEHIKLAIAGYNYRNKPFYTRTNRWAYYYNKNVGSHSIIRRRGVRYKVKKRALT